MILLRWIIGPQLIGVIMLLTGIIQKAYPPTDIDGPYGYHTPTSKQNQQTFDEGNRYSAKLMNRMGLGAIVIGLMIAPLIDKRHQYITGILTLITVIYISALLIRLTDKHLKNMFHNTDK